jgi:hypothetical protein
MKTEPSLCYMITYQSFNSKMVNEGRLFKTLWERKNEFIERKKIKKIM